MPRLIHLNGPSRIGKSTLARRYAADHPGVLVLDLDVIAGMIGGWQENFSAALETARAHGRQMVTHHLRSGHDVILPQLVTVHDRDPDPAFEETARAAGGDYVEIALLADEAEHRERLLAKVPATVVEAHVQAALEGSDLVERIRAHLDEWLAKRPGTATIDTTGLDQDATYERLLGSLEKHRLGAR